MRRSTANRLAAGTVWFAMLTGPLPVYAQGALQPIRIDPSITQRERVVRLEVFINGEATGAIEEFVLNPAANALSTRRGPLRKSGVKVP